MNEFYLLDLLLHFKKSNLYLLIVLKDEKFKKSPFRKLRKSGSWENPIIYMDLNGLYGIRGRKCINSIGKSWSEEEPYAITVCNGCDGFEWRWLKKPECGDECFKNHEEAHIVWFEILRPDACRGRAKGSNPALEPGDKPKTECYAYEVSSKCMEEMRIRVNMSGYTQKCRTFIKINYERQVKHMKKFCKAAGGWPW